VRSSGLTKKAEPPPTRDVNRDSGTDRANGGWLRRLVRLLVVITHLFLKDKSVNTTATMMMKLSAKQQRQACGLGPEKSG